MRWRKRKGKDSNRGLQPPTANNLFSKDKMSLDFPKLALPTVSMVEGVTGEYHVDNGQTIITLRSEHRIKPNGVDSGVGVLSFLDAAGRGGKRGLYFSIPQPQRANIEEGVGDDGSQTLTVRLDRLWPAAGLMHRYSAGEGYRTWVGGEGGKVGEFQATGVLIAAPHGGDIWVALLRAPWSPFRLQMEKTELALSQRDARASASLSPSGDAGFSGEMSVSGTAYKKVFLTLRRTLGPITLEDVLVEVTAEGGMQAFQWKPVVRDFDLLFVGKHPGMLSPLDPMYAAKKMAEAVGTTFLPPQTDFVLCDSPMVRYAVALKGDRGMLKHDEDSANLALTW